MTEQRDKLQRSIIAHLDTINKVIEDYIREMDLEIPNGTFVFFTVQPFGKYRSACCQLEAGKCKNGKAGLYLLDANVLWDGTYTNYDWMNYLGEDKYEPLQS